ncbi:hypothetical protein [Nocardioides marmotae]|uniref:Uncharacterized protein n=1 Tax=Nocardioides marmotae TaxID=2663857 RepID=A0A6I3J9H8_9ACTN|nr:hypothetical protein [Nocardioides marmotae]MCR6030452.1 hypothetical protein [Gordonia jinghuaiqii]MBC9734584.1 hypothetical protein [Nocardioides marmotae]MTB85685.1 hypothetical protein [Nocardioides marmotae]MTB94088.1 hypothetical protein [Nocardioides marmotae]QKE00389.1 hypothetical protein HPC71_04315 [Nocardioides marmotae]
MRLPLRRSAAAGPADEPAPAPAPIPATTLERPARPVPPRGRPVATYAAVLDGEHLWLAVEAAPGTLALRETGSEEVLTLVGDHEDSLSHVSVRADLLALPGTDDATYDAVLVGPGGRAPRPVWTPPLADVGPDVQAGPTIVPTSRDGSLRFALERAEDGTLRLVRTAVAEPLPRLASVISTGDAVELHVVGAIGGELQLRAGGPDGEVVASVPLVTGRAVLHRDAVPLDRGRKLAVTAGTATAARPVTRDANDLREANPATLLPHLYLDDADRPLWRLVWTADRTLGVRVPPRDRTDGDRTEQDRTGEDAS